MGPALREPSAVAEKMRHYLDRVLRVAVRVDVRLDTALELVEIVTDPDTMNDLKRAEQEKDEDARPYEEIRRELGLA